MLDKGLPELDSGRWDMSSNEPVAEFSSKEDIGKSVIFFLAININQGVGISIGHTCKPGVFERKLSSWDIQCF